MNNEIGISIGGLQIIYGDEEAIRIASEIRADTVDFDLSDSRFDSADELSVYSRSDDEVFEYFNELRKTAENLGLKISQTHGRLRTFYNDEKKDIVTIENARKDCIATLALGAPYCVMHGVATTIMGPEAAPELMHELCFDTFNKIIPFAKKAGIIIASETLGDSPKYGCCDFFGSLSEYRKIFDRIRAERDNADYFVSCIDTGHCNKAMRFHNNPTPADFIRGMGNNVKCLHLNDNNTLTDQHKIPFTGTIDWDDVFSALSEIGYDGVYNMELNLRHFGSGFEIETAEFAIKVLRHYLSKH